MSMILQVNEMWIFLSSQGDERHQRKHSLLDFFRESIVLSLHAPVNTGELFELVVWLSTHPSIKPQTGSWSEQWNEEHETFVS